jgi:hypothetical protein
LQKELSRCGEAAIWQLYPVREWTWLATFIVL